MNIDVLNKIANQMVDHSKGILAIDESHGTCKKRFDALNIPVNEESRRSYRDMLVSAKSLDQYISGAILFDETIKQKTSNGALFPQYLDSIGILPGIKVDAGAKPFSCHQDEKITEGLDNLPQRMEEYKQLGAKFAKWRAVITIGSKMPSAACMIANSHALARYASICQEFDIVPIVEPEVLMDGEHDIKKCYEITNQMQNILFESLDMLDVIFSGIVLKPNMITAGSSCKDQASPDEIAELTVECLKNNVPKDVPGIAFLSGGQSDELATLHLNEMNKYETDWNLTFSYGRALQQPALKSWQGKKENTTIAQEEFIKRAEANSLATLASL